MGTYLPLHKSELTNRETEVVALAAGGLTNVAIAHRLHVSETVIKEHLRTASHKLGTHNRTHTVAVSLRSGIIE
jgi:DNA-binding NarL/FixJ family response regulator